MDMASRSGALARSSLFQRLTRTHRERLAASMTVREFVAGETLIRQGDPGDAVLLIVDGSIGVRLRRSGDEVELATLGAGAVLGEMALVTGAARNADAVAKEPGRALVLAASQFHDLAAEIPDLVDLLTEVVAGRLGRAACAALDGGSIAPVTERYNTLCLFAGRTPWPPY